MNKFGTKNAFSLGKENSYSKGGNSTKFGKINNEASNNQIDFTDYEARRLGLSYNPPMIILEYIVISSGKLYHHKMKLQKFLQQNSNSTLSQAMDYIKKKHAKYIQYGNLKTTQLQQLLQKILDKQKKQSGINNITNKVGSTYKKDNDFSKTSNNFNSKNSNSTNDKSNFSATGGLVSLNRPNSAINPSGNVNLNKLTTEQLNKEKQKMDVHFIKNQKKPGDKDFVYDLQTNFRQTKQSEWDDSDEEIEEDIV